jgi:hypothetical protein
MTEISNVVFAAVLLFSVSCGPRPNALKSGNDPGPSQADARAEIKGRWEQSCKSLDQKQLGTQYPRFFFSNNHFSFRISAGW